MSFKDKVVLVTGSTKGIGKEVALQFHELGANVIINSSSKEHYNSFDDELKNSPRFNYFQCDLTNLEMVEVMVRKIKSQFKGVDILVNNCGGLKQTGQFFDLEDDAWIESFNLNFMSAVRLSKLVAPMMKLKNFGRIINVSSITALQPGDYNPHYSTMKLGLINLTKHLSKLLCTYGITVNCVTPGIIKTEGWDSYIQNKSFNEDMNLEDIELQETNRVVAGVPMKRFGTPAEVASLILYIASNDASFMTGTNTVVDGGKHSGI